MQWRMHTESESSFVLFVVSDLENFIASRRRKQMATHKLQQKVCGGSSNRNSTTTLTRQSVLSSSNTIGLTASREMRQHALLNLVRMHICTGHVVAARKVFLFSTMTKFMLTMIQLLREAITVSRTSGDNFVLQQCMRQALSVQILKHSNLPRTVL